MKIAISGKGGVGKTLLASLLARTFARAGYKVLAIDADPDANLAANLGFPHPEQITPISEMDDLIEERVGVKPGQTGSFFKLNPKVDDLPEKFAVEHQGIKLMLMGRIKRGGTGCYCSEGALLKALISHLILRSKETVILDMEAGIEHLSRGTAAGVDNLIIVVEPGRRSLETAQRIFELAGELGLQNTSVVANKIRSESQKQFIIQSLPSANFLGFIPYDDSIISSDLATGTILDSSAAINDAVNGIFYKLTG